MAARSLVLLSWLAPFALGHVLPSAPLAERAGPLFRRDLPVTSCGDGIGSCPQGECCSGTGLCGTTEDYCQGPSCQIAYSNGACDANKPPDGVSTQDVPRPLIGSVPYGFLIQACATPSDVALTFDDGPGPYTSDLLDILDTYAIKATFFIAGDTNGRGMISDPTTPWPAVLRRMHASGHQLGSHTWTHQDLSVADDALRTTQVVYNEMAFRDVLGFFPTYLRPPYGACGSDDGCLDFLGSLGYHVVNYDIDTFDYLNDDPTLIQQSKDIFSAGLVDGGGDPPSTTGFIVLAHDIHYQTVVNLTAYMIQTLQDRGYRPVTLGDCLADPAENWYRDASGTSSDPAPPPPPATTTSAAPSATTSGAASTDPARLPVSTEGTCGPMGGSGGDYQCVGSAWGDCCSAYGFCGNTSDYCGGGCLPDYGTCSPTDSGGTTLAVSSNGLCGPSVKQTCAGSVKGACCSKDGFCGSTDGYCADGCQSGYGTCS